MKDLERRFLDAISAHTENGMTPREMAKRNPDKPLIEWIKAGKGLYDGGWVKQEWSPVKGDPGCCQESRYREIPL